MDLVVLIVPLNLNDTLLGSNLNDTSLGLKVTIRGDGMGKKYLMRRYSSFTTKLNWCMAAMLLFRGKARENFPMESSIHQPKCNQRLQQLYHQKTMVQLKHVITKYYYC